MDFDTATLDMVKGTISVAKQEKARVVASGAIEVVGDNGKPITIKITFVAETPMYGKTIFTGDTENLPEEVNQTTTGFGEKFEEADKMALTNSVISLLKEQVANYESNIRH